jgi:lipoprotein-anchoring transpeptidase ErfK/SrfK
MKTATSAGLLLVLTAGFAGLIDLNGAVAGTTGYPPPPLMLSPDLAEPWIAQLRPQGYRNVVTTPAVVRRPNEPPVGMWQGQPPPVRVVAPAQMQMVPINPGSDGSAQVQQRMANADASGPSQRMAPEFLPTEVEYRGPQKPGTIIIDTNERHLYLVEENGRARRYGVGVGRPGFEWAGEHTVTRKAEWPDWTPPEAMLKRQPNLPHHMDGGPTNPLGARALYLGSTEYRIHGTSEPWTIGHAVSSGCIRMRNQDVTDLYERVKVGTKVIVM